MTSAGQSVGQSLWWSLTHRQNPRERWVCVGVSVWVSEWMAVSGWVDRKGWWAGLASSSYMSPVGVSSTLNDIVWQVGGRPMGLTTCDTVTPTRLRRRKVKHYSICTLQEGWGFLEWYLGSGARSEKVDFLTKTWYTSGLCKLFLWWVKKKSKMMKWSNEIVVERSETYRGREAPEKPTGGPGNFSKKADNWCKSRPPCLFFQQIIVYEINTIL